MGEWTWKEVIIEEPVYKKDAPKPGKPQVKPALQVKPSSISNEELRRMREEIAGYFEEFNEDGNRLEGLKKVVQQGRKDMANAREDMANAIGFTASANGSTTSWTPDRKVLAAGVGTQIASVLGWLVNDKLSWDMPEPVLINLAGLIIIAIAYFTPKGQ